MLFGCIILAITPSVKIFFPAYYFFKKGIRLTSLTRLFVSDDIGRNEWVDRQILGEPGTRDIFFPVSGLKTA